MKTIEPQLPQGLEKKCPQVLCLTGLTETGIFAAVALGGASQIHRNQHFMVDHGARRIRVMPTNAAIKSPAYTAIAWNDLAVVAGNGNQTEHVLDALNKGTGHESGLVNWLNIRNQNPRTRDRLGSDITASYGGGRFVHSTINHNGQGQCDRTIRPVSAVMSRMTYHANWDQTRYAGKELTSYDSEKDGVALLDELFEMLHAPTRVALCAVFINPDEGTTTAYVRNGMDPLCIHPGL